MCQFSDKTDNFDFLGPNLPKNGYWGRNFKNLSLDLESAPPRYHVCQFSVKMDNFEFFSLNLGKLPNYVQYFGSNVVEGVAESWVEAEINWVGVDGAGWRWVHGLVIPVLKVFRRFLENHLWQSAYLKLITMFNMGSVADVFLEFSQKYWEQLFWKKTFQRMFHISLKNTPGWVLSVKQHSKKFCWK